MQNKDILDKFWNTNLKDIEPDDVCSLPIYMDDRVPSSEIIYHQEVSLIKETLKEKLLRRIKCLKKIW